MTNSPLQSPKRTAQAPCGVSLHPKPNGNVSLRYAVSILADRSEGHSNNSLVLCDFSDEIDVKGRGSVIEDHDDFIAVSGFAYGAHSMAFMAAREETK